MIKKQRFILGLFLVTSLNGAVVLAKEQNPSYWQVNSAHVINIYEKSNLDARVLAIISAKAQGLKNLGCKGNVVQRKTWCKVEYREQIGWVEARYLSPYNPPAATFAKSDTINPFQLNCDKIEYSTDKLICQDPQLKKLDDQLNAVYKQAIELAKESSDDANTQEDILKSSQQMWLNERNDCWKKSNEMAECLKKLYETRITTLQADWNLEPPKAANHFICEDKSAFLIIEYTSTLQPSAVVEYEDKKHVFIATPTASGVRYSGEADSYVWLKGKEALFAWDLSKPIQHCQLIEPAQYSQ